MFVNHFQYDLNGNMTRDDYRSLSLQYNSFNLPWEMDFGNNNKVTYFYDGAGRKLTKIVATGTGAPLCTEYLGQLVHQYTMGGVSSLKYIITLEGRLKNKGTDAAPVWEWEYNLTDHLGNVRSVIRPGTGNLAEIMEYTNYFHFGMKKTPGLSQSSTDNKYLYNGKEMQDDFGLNWYDYGARFYDPALGRWHTVDPLAENYDGWSPYNYTLNNPINNIDPNGMWVETDEGYNTVDPDEIAQFLRLLGIGPNNQPKDAEQAKDQESAREGVSNIAKGIEKLYKAEYDIISYLPFGSLFNEIMDQQTGYESDDNIVFNLGFDVAGVFLPGIKFANGPLKNIVRFTDETVQFSKKLPDGTAIKLMNRIPEGFAKTKFRSEGQKVYSNGKVFISPDVTGHIGGRWKAATKLEYLKNVETRIGTFDENLYRIGK